MAKCSGIVLNITLTAGGASEPTVDNGAFHCVEPGLSLR